MKFVAAGCCTRKQLRFNQTIRNLTSDDLGISTVVIRLEVTGLKKTRVVRLLDLFERKERDGHFALVRVNHLQMIGLMVLMLMFYLRVVSVDLVLSGVSPILRNGYGI